ncbi:Uncharacterized protein Fot_08341 [Forsythia ovata]|uniref:Uncharacterized protein n=1 Tax=Forsythia ovata TaxID=205694 RepID=A0ABD1WYF3_9LAMI
MGSREEWYKDHGVREAQEESMGCVRWDSDEVGLGDVLVELMRTERGFCGFHFYRCWWILGFFKPYTLQDTGVGPSMANFHPNAAVRFYPIDRGPIFTGRHLSVSFWFV